MSGGGRVDIKREMGGSVECEGCRFNASAAWAGGECWGWSRYGGCPGAEEAWGGFEERKKELVEYRVGGAVVLDQVSLDAVLAANG